MADQNVKEFGVSGEGAIKGVSSQFLLPSVSPDQLQGSFHIIVVSDQPDPISNFKNCGRFGIGW
jgi:hypothetical protein